jgi:hypothetical protein
MVARMLFMRILPGRVRKIEIGKDERRHDATLGDAPASAPKNRRWGALSCYRVVVVSQSHDLAAADRHTVPVGEFTLFSFVIHGDRRYL